MVEILEYDIYYKPNHKEISLLLMRLEEFSNNKSKIYRLLRDFQGCMKNENRVLNALCDVCKSKFNIGRLITLTFYIFITTEFDYTSKDLNAIKEFIREKNFVYDEYTRDYDFYAKFDNMYDAVKWIVSYRVSKLYFQSNLRKINETS
jgi:hypothetical protein